MISQPHEQPVDRADGGVRAWDLPTRLFHWALVMLIICAYVTGEYAEALGDNVLLFHRCNGIAILILLVFRLLWGFVGSPTARFSHFLSSPWRAAAYALDLLRGRARHFLGHNPLGAWMVIALLLVVAVQAGLGLFASDDTGSAAGPLARLAASPTGEMLTKWHHRLFKRVLLPLMALHILAAFAYQFLKREPLITAMVKGRKPEQVYEDRLGHVVIERPALRAVICLGASIAMVFAILLLLSGRII